MPITMAEQGKFLEAIQEFYAEDATMQENNQPPRVGLAALLENERRALASLQEIRVNRADSFIVDRASAINWVYLFIDARAPRFGGMKWHIKFDGTARSSTNDSFTLPTQR